MEQFVANPAFKLSGVRRWRYMGPYNRIGEGELILNSGPVTKTVKHGGKYVLGTAYKFVTWRKLLAILYGFQSERSTIQNLAP